MKSPSPTSQRLVVSTLLIQRPLICSSMMWFSCVVVMFSSYMCGRYTIYSAGAKRFEVPSKIASCCSISSFMYISSSILDLVCSNYVTVCRYTMPVQKDTRCQ